MAKRDLTKMSRWRTTALVVWDGTLVGFRSRRQLHARKAP
jgi:hypothetical protein